MGVLKAGASSKVINCKIGDPLAGMLSPRISDRIRDNLEANAIFFTDGDARVMLIGCDLLGLSSAYIEEVADLIENNTKIPARDIIISCTHTHSGPYTRETFLSGANQQYLQDLKFRLAEAAEEAVSGAVPVMIGWAAGEARIGYNRRVCRADGSHTMYGGASDDAFAGLEGPDDSSHAVLFAVDEKGRTVGLIHNNTCHATTGCSFNYISADYPGAARSLIRDALGSDTPVLYLQGACGDQCRFNQLKPGPRDSERRLKEIAVLLAGESLRLMRDAAVCDNAVLNHVFRQINVGIRIPSEDMVKHAKSVVEKGLNQNSTTGDISGGYVFQKGILKLYEKYKDNPYEKIPLHALRVGGFGLATVPCEYYCQFGLDIKTRSPADVTAVSELTHGSLGYCPTVYGILGGGYSGATTYGSRLEPFAGYMMAEELARMLYKLFK